MDGGLGRMAHRVVHGTSSIWPTKRTLFGRVSVSRRAMPPGRFTATRHGPHRTWMQDRIKSPNAVAVGMHPRCGQFCSAVAVRDYGEFRLLLLA